jgi:hypothetical protein
VWCSYRGVHGTWQFRGVRRGSGAPVVHGVHVVRGVVQWCMRRLTGYTDWEGARFARAFPVCVFGRYVGCNALAGWIGSWVAWCMGCMAWGGACLGWCMGCVGCLALCVCVGVGGVSCCCLPLGALLVVGVRGVWGWCTSGAWGACHCEGCPAWGPCCLLPALLDGVVHGVRYMWVWCMGCMGCPRVPQVVWMGKASWCSIQREGWKAPMPRPLNRVLSSCFLRAQSSLRLSEWLPHLHGGVHQQVGVWCMGCMGGMASGPAAALLPPQVPRVEAVLAVAGEVAGVGAVVRRGPPRPPAHEAVHCGRGGTWCISQWCMGCMVWEGVHHCTHPAWPGSTRPWAPSAAAPWGSPCRRG